MQPMTKLTTAFVLSGISASIAFAQTSITPAVRFADGFENDDLTTMWPFTATGTTSLAGTLGPTRVTASATDNVFEGNFAIKIVGRNGASSVPTSSTDPASHFRLSRGALFQEQTNDETYVTEFYLFDVYGQTGLPDNVGNARYWVSLRATDGTTPFQANQLIALGLWNNANTSFGTGAVNNMWFGAAPAGQALGNHFAARIVTVAPTHGFVTGTTTLALGGNSAPSWAHFGVGPTNRRSEGWHRMTIVYNVRRTEFYRDGVLQGYWDINPNLTGTARKINAIVLNPPETNSVDVWVDKMSVRSYPNGSMQILPQLGDVVNPSAATSVAFSLEMVPINGNTNSAVSTWTANMNADGEINVGFPNDVRGDYQLVIDGGSWLKKRVPVTLTETGVFQLSVPMQNGDPDSSGEVDAVDIDLVIANFGGMSVGPNNGDLDLSDEVDAVDIDIAIANFGGLDE